ncbi:MAG: dihydrofolate reductase [Spirochaetaceae bacterium]
MISIIVAIDKNRGIGYKGNLLTFVPGDLPRFKKITTGHTVIMGRKTFESLPKGPLPNRKNIVITRNMDLNIKGTTVVNSLKEAMSISKNDDEVFIIGGGDIYKESLPYAEKLYITHLEKEFNADTFFPEFINEWNISDVEDHKENPDLIFSYVTYTKN